MILNENFLREEARKEGLKKTASIYLTESLHFQDGFPYDLFISHSFLDRIVIKGLVSLFKQAGYKIYVDWIDDSNLDRNKVTYKTANILKKRINQSKGLAYISTQNIIDSKWCPWELGLADGSKGKACILPIMDDSFRGIEYLEIYPHLEFEKNVYGVGEFWVCHNEADSIRLGEWLDLDNM